MALSAATVWEVRTTGSDTANSGGFVPGGGGTDFSQQDAAQYAGTDLTVDATTNTKVTAASHSFATADVGNILRVTGGTSWTAGFYQIASVAAGAATLDRSPAAVGTSGGSYCVGGALASIGQVGAPMTSGNQVWIASGTYLVTSATSNVAGGCLIVPAQSSNQFATRVTGYGSTRGDGGTRPIIRASGITNFVLMTLATGTHGENLTVDGASLGQSKGMTAGGATVLRVKAMNCTNIGIFSGEQVLCEATGCATAPGLYPTVGFYCHAYANAGIGMSGQMLVGCLSEGNTGASSHGFDFQFGTDHLVACTAQGNGGNGINVNGGTGNAAYAIVDCVAYGNGGYGLACSASYDAVYLLNCAFGSNTSGPTNNVVAANNRGPITLTANPFNNSAGLDFGPNATAGGGALVRAASVAATLPGSATGNYRDLGAAQHQDSGGGGTSYYAG